MDSLTTRAAKDKASAAGDKVAVRKLKKRELDRKAQRVARERTKNRIQELESLVEQLKADTVNPDLSNLVNSLSQVTQQRDELQLVLRSIDETIQRHLRKPAPSESSSGTGPQKHHSDIVGSSYVADAAISPTAASQPNHDIDGCSNANTTADCFQSTDDFQDTSPVADFGSTDFQAASLDSPTHSLFAGGSRCQADQPLPEERLHTIDPSPDIIVPRPDRPCDCVQPGSASTWRSANAALGKITALSPAQLAIEDFTSEDTPVRVVLDGWDSVVKAGKMSISWWKLRQIDQVCFSTCGDVERLAILRTMHLLLTYHGDPSQDRCEAVCRALWVR